MDSLSSPNQPSGSGLNEHPSSSDPCATITQCLMRYHTGSEEEFSRKAIESLIKKLKDKRDELDALIAAVTSQGKIAARCITIQRTLDGRLQVAGRKGFPHVVYAKIWRWPDLHKNELKHLPICQCAFDLKCDLVCVNPYHYERVVPPGIGSLDLSGLRIDHRTLPEGSSALSPNSDDSSTAHSVEAGLSLAQRLSLAGSALPSQILRIGVGDLDGGPSSIQRSDTDKMNKTPVSAHEAAAELLEQLRAGPSTSGAASAPGPSTSAMLNNLAQSTSQLQSMLNATNPVLLPTPTRVTNWSTITYYEYDKKVGDTYPATMPTVFVDGGTGACNPSRFCLTSLSNPQRNEAVEKCRSLIRGGIRLEVKGEGDIWLTCLSHKPVYVQSFYLDRETGRSPGDGIHKIYTKATVKIFDLGLCYQMICTQKARKLVAMDPQAPFQLSEAARNRVANIGPEDLRRLCTLVISFVECWGPDSSPQQDCPCWIEIEVTRGLHLMDEVLQSPSYP